MKAPTRGSQYRSVDRELFRRFENCTLPRERLRSASAARAAAPTSRSLCRSPCGRPAFLRCISDDSGNFGQRSKELAELFQNEH